MVGSLVNAGWFKPRCHAGILQFPKASLCPIRSAGFLGFCFTIFTKKCQSNCLQVRKLFPTRKFANHGCGDRPFFSQATNQMEKNSRNKMLGVPSQLGYPAVCSYEKPRCLLAELRGNSDPGEDLEDWALRSLQNCCSSEVSAAKHC